MAADCLVIAGVGKVHPDRAAASLDEGSYAHPACLVVRMSVEVGDQAEDHVLAAVDTRLELVGHPFHDRDGIVVELDFTWRAGGAAATRDQLKVTSSRSTASLFTTFDRAWHSSYETPSPKESERVTRIELAL
ncbi:MULTISPECIES: hypothetical protein [unclassified Streptomyces]|uniref:hypothetical protein n=1 Tax=unclassified Streptomyces TaxID=2593676 RepID=UPI0032455324